MTNGMDVLIDTGRIQKRVAELADEISRDFQGRVPHLVGVLRGAFQFTRDLSSAMRSEHHVSYISVASYGNNTHSSGSIQLRMDLTAPATGEDVIIVDDIVDTGNTLGWLVQHMGSLGARSIKTCCLLDKGARRTREVPTDYVGFPIDDLFVVGYGLDYQEQYRELPFISFVAPREVLL